MTSADGRLDGIELMQRTVERAAADPTVEVATHWFEIAGDPVAIRFVGTAVAEPMTRALGHARTIAPVSSEAVFRLDVLDSAASGAELSPVLQFMMRAAGVPNLGTRHEIPELTSDGCRAIAVPWDGVLAMYDRDAKRGWVWLADHTQLPLWDFGAPFRSVLNWWLSDTGRHCVHAAAVGFDDGAVLITGKGGSGKSTSALACLGSGLGYLSDDYCVIETQPTPVVHSLYSSGKLRGEIDLARFPHLRSWVANIDRIGEEKQLMFLAERAPSALLASAPLRAIVLPSIVPEGPTRLSRISGGTALRALAPTSMFQLPDSGPAALASMASLVRTIPSFVMEAGPDVSEIPGVITALLTDLRERQS